MERASSIHRVAAVQARGSRAAAAPSATTTPVMLLGFMQRMLGYSMSLCFAIAFPFVGALAQLRSSRADARGVPMPLCGGLVATNLMLAFSSLYAYYISYVAVCFGWRHALRNVALPSAPFVLAALAFAAFGRCVRRDFAEHFYTLGLGGGHRPAQGPSAPADRISAPLY